MIKSIEKAVDIIGLLANSESPLSLAELSKSLGIVKSTLHGHISSLVEVGYVVQDAETGRYFLGYKLFEIGNTVSRKWNVRKVAHHYMQELSELTGNAIHHAVLDDGEVLYISKLDSTRSLPLASDIGVKTPVHCTGVGKVLISGLSPYEVRRITRKRGLAKYTETTITELDKLQSELELVRERGYAIDEQECVEGLRCVAVPIYNNKGDILSALSVAGSIQQMQGSYIEDIIERLLKASDEISAQMGYQKT